MNRSVFRLGLVSALVLAMCASSSLAFAQGGTTSTLNGTVVDTSGAVLPGADISAKHSTTGVVTTAVSNAEGAFSIAALPIGTYVVTVTLQGFKTSIVNNVVLTSAQGANIKATLEVGGVTEQVTVSSTSEIIQTQSTTVSSTINTNQITKLPLTSRSAMDFVNFLPGVSTPGGNRDATINGLPQGVINITLDGINIQDNTNRSTDGFFAIVSPRLDAIEEVSVTTAGQGADAGQGAVQIKFVTRSGGNTYTGSALPLLPQRQTQCEHVVQQSRRDADREVEAEPDRRTLRRSTGDSRTGLARQGLLLRQLRRAAPAVRYDAESQPDEAGRCRRAISRSGPSTSTCCRSGRVMRRRRRRSTVDPTIAALLSDIRTAANTAGHDRIGRCQPRPASSTTCCEVQAPFPDGPPRLQHHRQPSLHERRSTTTGSPMRPIR